MWESWKKKVVNFFYEELDEEEQKSTTYDPEKETAAHRMLQQNRDVNTKMKYQYPNKNSAPFRFPVIPDQQKERRASKQALNSRRPASGVYTQSSSSSTAYGSRTDKTIEDTPAFMRRRKEVHQPEKRKLSKQQTQQSSGAGEQADAKIDLRKHTRPEELDRIFQKQAGKLKEETQAPKRIIRYEDLSPPAATTLRQTVASKEQEIPSTREAKEKKTSPISREEVIVPEILDAPVQHEETIPDVITDEDYQSISVESTEVSNSTFDKEYSVNIESESISQSETQETKTNNIGHHEIEHQDVPNYLLNDPFIASDDDVTWLEEQQVLLEQTLTHFNIKANIVNVTQGPAVTRFEIQPALGVKVSKIRNLADDIKLNLSAKDIRIEAPIPGKNTVGIEVPNKYPQVVGLQEIIDTEKFQHAPSPLTIALGLTIDGDPLITDIGKMPHGLIAGATGSGKSVCINTILLSLLYKAHHEEVKMLLIDPKMVELSPYNGIPHLISPVITDVKAATMALKWAVEEMENRYEQFVAAGVRNIEKYNEKVVKQNNGTDKMPYIVIVIDELADLMMVAPQDVEDAICRIAQKARACGIHLLIATQRPSVDVITGLIKANIPTRIAFSVSSQVDSRTMIDTAGAEKLLGKGDMLFVENGSNKSVRLQGPFVSDDEIDRVANYVRQIAKPNYLFEQEQLLLDIQEEEEDELLEEVMMFVIEQNQASTSLLQRRFRIGYNRAARLIDTLEDRGVISGQNGSKPREVLVTKNQITK